MRTILLIAVFIFFHTALPAQAQTLKITDGCSYQGKQSPENVFVFNASAEADKIVTEIVAAIGLAKNFSVKSSNIQNALATSENNVRYILYSTSFLEKFKKDAKTKWAAYSVLAHEIGHHLNGHNFSENIPGKRKLMELEADQFSGTILFLLGASLDEAQAGIESFGLEGETGTHPSRAARREAIANGWKSGEEQRRPRPERPATTTGQPVEFRPAPPPGGLKRRLGNYILETVDVTVTGMEKKGSSLFVYVSLKNMSAQENQDPDICGTKNTMVDENGNYFTSKRVKIGNFESTSRKAVRLVLVPGNTARGFIEFEVGEVEVRKIGKLEMYLDTEILEFFDVSF
jgi:hypothetical protein